MSFERSFFLAMNCLILVTSVLGESSEEKVVSSQSIHRKLSDLSLERWMLHNSESTPAFSKGTPAVAQATPAVSEATPPVSEAMLTAAAATPSVSEATPITDRSTPSVSETEPAVVEAKPDAAVTIPSTSTPIIEATPVTVPKQTTTAPSSSVTVAQTPFGAKQQPIFCEGAVVAFDKCIQALNLKPGQAPGPKTCLQPRRELNDCHMMKKAFKEILSMSVPVGKELSSFSELAPVNCDSEKSAKNDCTERQSAMFPQLKTTSKTKLAMQEAQKTAQIELKCADENYLFNVCRQKKRGSKLLDDAKNATLVEMKAGKQSREKHHHSEDVEDKNVPKLDGRKEKSLNKYKNELATTSKPIDCEMVRTEFDACMAIALTTPEGKKMHKKGQEKDLEKTDCVVEKRKLDICHEQQKMSRAKPAIATKPPDGALPVDVAVSVGATIPGNVAAPVSVSVADSIVVPVSEPVAQSVNASAADTPAPAADTPAPAADTPAPAADTPAPAAGTLAPATDTQAPDANTPAPAADTPASDANTLAPATNTPAPDVDTQAPATETPAPPADTPTFATETPAPKADTPTPKADTPALAADTLAPAEDTPALATTTPSV